MSPDVNVFVVVVLWCGGSGKHLERAQQGCPVELVMVVQARCLGMDSVDGRLPWPIGAKHIFE